MPLLRFIQWRLMGLRIARFRLDGGNGTHWRGWNFERGAHKNLHVENETGVQWQASTDRCDSGLKGHEGAAGATSQ